MSAYLRIFKLRGTWTVELYEVDELEEQEPSRLDHVRMRYVGEPVAADAFERGAQWLRDYEGTELTTHDQKGV